MKYTVLWTATAEEDLARLWAEATDRDEITSAAHTLDVLLGEDPLRCGESRYSSLRVVHAAPLGVDVDVEQDDRVVRVLRVWRFEQRRT